MSQSDYSGPFGLKKSYYIQGAQVPRLIYRPLKGIYIPYIQLSDFPIFRDFAIFVIFDGFGGPGMVSIGPERDFAPDALNISSGARK